ncbi:MAG: SUMF1/EgtB/PvdO family nonheme iron enzyme [Spirochaetales bacterium]|nr:SUMF1/EgtB/PvdO family nonheme iron enzyme [Spirochaetales bacterium]
MDKQFDGKKFAKTSEVVVTDETVTVAGDETIWNRYFDSSADENDIRKGRFGMANTSTVIKPYVIGQFEVTEELYRAVMEDTEYNASPSKHCLDIEDVSVLAIDESADLRPVDNVNLLTAAYFCNILTEKVMGAEHKVYYFYNVYSAYGQIQSATIVAYPDKLGYRLPTQAEWEFAARGGLAAYNDKADSSWYYAYSGCDTTLDRKVRALWESYEVTDDVDPRIHHGYSYFNEADKEMLSDYAWFNHNAGLVIGQGNPGYGTHEVGMKRPNSLGLYDMGGNVCEITADFTGDDYARNAAPLGGDYEDFTYNQMLIERSKDGVVGFRVVRTIE